MILEILSSIYIIRTKVNFKKWGCCMKNGPLQAKSLVFMICFFVIIFANYAYLSENNQIFEKYGFGTITLTGDTTEVKEVDINKPFDIEIQCNFTTGYDIFISYFPGAIKLITSTTDPTT